MTLGPRPKPPGVAIRDLAWVDVLLILTSLLAAPIMGFIHGLVPVMLVSMTDAIAAIILSILALIWALFMRIGSLIALIRALRVDRA